MIQIIASAVGGLMVEAANLVQTGHQDGAIACIIAVVFLCFGGAIAQIAGEWWGRH